jgi:transcriptional regulator with XRE-family HTH domain
MNTYDRIKLLCDRNGITIAELERQATVGNGTIRRWSTTLPSGDKLQRVAKYLNVTMDYLVNGGDSEDEEIRAIARNMKILSKDKRKLLNDLIKTMSDSADEELKK